MSDSKSPIDGSGNRFGHILAAVDAGEWTGPVLEVSAEIGRPFHSELHVVHTEQFLPPTYFTDGGIRELQRVLEEQRRGAGDWLRRSVETHLPSTPAHTHIVEAPAVAGILQASRALQAELIVLGTHGRTGVNHLLLGSVAERVVREAHVPVITVRRGEDGHAAWHRPLQRILCPVNFTDVSVGALEVALDMASRFDAQLTVINVADGDAPDTDDLAQRLQSLCDGDISCRITPRIEHGETATVVIETAAQSATDLIVIGARQRPLLQSWVMGTTSVRVMRHAQCPVLTVPAAVASAI